MVQVSGGADAAGALTVVLTYVDLRYDDGHVERWIGPGSMRELPTGSGRDEDARRLGEVAIELPPAP